jgi:hypothetical protein
VQDLLVPLVPHQIGDHVLDLREPCLELLGVAGQTLRSLVLGASLLPAHAEDAGLVTATLAGFLRDLAEGEGEDRRDQRVLCGGEVAELGKGLEAVDEPLPQHPLVAGDLRLPVEPDRHQWVALGAVGEELAR